MFRAPKYLSWGLCALAVLLLGSAEAATYTVKSGDTLYSIATRNKTTVAKLMAANGISDPRKLRIGQKLTLSPGSASKAGGSSTSRVSSVGKGKRVVIDAGHGGHDRGAHRGGVQEARLNLQVATKLESYLKDMGYSTTMTRRSDVFISLSRRAAIANQYRSAIFVSIHFNSARETWVRGVETFYAGSRGRSLANAIQREMVNRLGVRNRGAQPARFTVLTQTRCPAALVECGFLSNSSERSRCASSSYQSSVARAIADGIRKYRWN